MAEAGFPWNAPLRPLEPSILSEKDAGLTPPTVTKDSGVLKDATNNRSAAVPADEVKPKINGSIKKRSDSLRTGNAARQNVRFTTEPALPKEPIKRIPVRTIPPWVQDADEDDLVEASLLLPNTPGSALVAQHNHSPSTTQRPLLNSQVKPSGGYPMSSGERRDEPTSRWVSFARASAYPRENFQGEKVTPEWLNENFTDYAKPWLADHNEDDNEDGSDKYRAFRRKRRVWYKRAHYAIMRNPFVPLAFRAIVILFAILAMSLGASIFHENNIILNCNKQPAGQRNSDCARQIGQKPLTYGQSPSALLAIIVDAVAIIYSLYITYDEYFSKPLGLRSPAAKVRLVLLDLFFIVFQSANLSLAFNSLSFDEGPCKEGSEIGTAVRFDHVCHRAEALSSVLLISLIAWLLTFSISILRYVIMLHWNIWLTLTDWSSALIPNDDDTNIIISIFNKQVSPARNLSILERQRWSMDKGIGKSNLSPHTSSDGPLSPYTGSF